MSYHLSIVTPIGKVFDGQVESSIAPGQEGFLEILSGHAPTVTILKAGSVILRQKEKRAAFSIGPGILEVDGQHNALLLTDSAKSAA